MNYLTMEDPRNEDPEEICKEISLYIEKENGKYKIITDRGEAIKKAIFGVHFKCCFFILILFLFYHLILLNIF